MNYEYEVKRLFDFTVLKAEIINFASQEAIELLTYWVSTNLHEIPRNLSLTASEFRKSIISDFLRWGVEIPSISTNASYPTRYWKLCYTEDGKRLRKQYTLQLAHDNCRSADTPSSLKKIHGDSWRPIPSHQVVSNPIIRELLKTLHLAHRPHTHSYTQQYNLTLFKAHTGVFLGVKDEKSEQMLKTFKGSYLQAINIMAKRGIDSSFYLGYMEDSIQEYLQVCEFTSNWYLLKPASVYHQMHDIPIETRKDPFVREIKASLKRGENVLQRAVYLISDMYLSLTEIQEAVNKVREKDSSTSSIGWDFKSFVAEVLYAHLCSVYEAPDSRLVDLKNLDLEPHKVVLQMVTRIHAGVCSSIKNPRSIYLKGTTLYTPVLRLKVPVSRELWGHPIEETEVLVSGFHCDHDLYSWPSFKALIKLPLQLPDQEVTALLPTGVSGSATHGLVTLLEILEIPESSWGVFKKEHNIHMITKVESRQVNRNSHFRVLENLILAIHRKLIEKLGYSWEDTDSVTKNFYSFEGEIFRLKGLNSVSTKFLLMMGEPTKFPISLGVKAPKENVTFRVRKYNADLGLSWETIKSSGYLDTTITRRLSQAEDIINHMGTKEEFHEWLQIIRNGINISSRFSAVILTYLQNKYSGRSPRVLHHLSMSYKKAHKLFEILVSEALRKADSLAPPDNTPIDIVSIFANLQNSLPQRVKDSPLEVSNLLEVLETLDSSESAKYISWITSYFIPEPDTRSTLPDEVVRWRRLLTHLFSTQMPFKTFNSDREKVTKAMELQNSSKIRNSAVLELLEVIYPLEECLLTTPSDLITKFKYYLKAVKAGKEGLLLDTGKVPALNSWGLGFRYDGIFTEDPRNPNADGSLPLMRIDESVFETFHDFVYWIYSAFSRNRFPYNNVFSPVYYWRKASKEFVQFPQHPRANWQMSPAGGWCAVTNPKYFTEVYQKTHAFFMHNDPIKDPTLYYVAHPSLKLVEGQTYSKQHVSSYPTEHLNLDLTLYGVGLVPRYIHQLITDCGYKTEIAPENINFVEFSTQTIQWSLSKALWQLTSFQALQQGEKIPESEKTDLIYVDRNDERVIIASFDGYGVEISLTHINPVIVKKFTNGVWMRLINKWSK